jgi:ABC-type transport system substrate-binding protein
MPKFNWGVSIRRLSAVLGLSLGFGTAMKAQDRTFTLASLAPAHKTLPLLQYAGEADVLRMLVAPPILYWGGDGRLTCVLCKEPPEIELRRDEKKKTTELVITLEVARKLDWGDGKPITRKDIKFTLETMAKAPYPRGQHPILPIQRIELDPTHAQKISLVLRHRRADGPQLFAISLLPAHRAPQVAALLKAGATPEGTLQVMKDPAYWYGPFRVAEASAHQLKLVPNKRTEWEDLPKHDLAVRFYPDLKTLAGGLQAGEIDQTLSQQLSWSQYQDLQALIPDLTQRYEAELLPGTSLEVLLLNLRSPILNNPQLRMGLFHAINRQAINQTYYAAGGTAPEGLLRPELLDRLGEKPQPAYQPKLAGHMLEAAGWTQKPGQSRLSENGTPLILTFNCTEARLRTGWHKSVEQDLAAQGISLKTELIPEEEYFRQTLGHLRFKDLACMRWRLPPLTSPIHLFHSLAIPDAENGYVGLNYSGWDQTVVNRILERMVREHGTTHFLRLMSRLEKQFLTDIPAIPLVYLPEVTLSRKVAPDSETRNLQKTLAIYPADEEGGRRKL